MGNMFPEFLNKFNRNMKISLFAVTQYDKQTSSFFLCDKQNISLVIVTKKRQQY